jgi:hypothetical protein
LRNSLAVATSHLSMVYTSIDHSQPGDPARLSLTGV